MAERDSRPLADAQSFNARIDETLQGADGVVHGVGMLGELCYASVKKRSHRIRGAPLRSVGHGRGRNRDFEERHDPKNQKITTLA